MTDRPIMLSSAGGLGGAFFRPSKWPGVVPNHKVPLSLLTPDVDGSWSIGRLTEPHPRWADQLTKGKGLRAEAGGLLAREEYFRSRLRIPEILEAFNGKPVFVVSLGFRKEGSNLLASLMLLCRSESDNHSVGMHDAIESSLHDVLPGMIAIKLVFGTKVPREVYVAGTQFEGGMDRVSRCLHCGKRLVPTPTFGAERKLQCVWCNKIEQMKTDFGEWSDSQLAKSASKGQEIGEAVRRNEKALSGR